MDTVFEKLAFIDVFDSQYVPIYLLRFIRGKRLKVFKMRKLCHVFGLLFKQCKFLGKNEHHIWKYQSLFFYLHITCYYKYAIGLQSLAIK
jgi:hypothetical protein